MSSGVSCVVGDIVVSAGGGVGVTRPIVVSAGGLGVTSVCKNVVSILVLDPISGV